MNEADPGSVMREKQVDRSHYWNETYLDRDRFLHYREQFVAVLKLNPSSVLEVGPGPGLLANMLKRICGDVVTVDFAEDLKPDIVADIKSMPLKNASFDLVCSFQVLEHLPWQEVPAALREMARIAKKYVLFSVPDSDRIRRSVVSVRCMIFGHSFGFALTRKRHRGVHSAGEHHWEIGVNGASTEVIEEMITKAGMARVDCWRNGVNCYFLCGVAGAAGNAPDSAREPGT